MTMRPLSEDSGLLASRRGLLSINKFKIPKGISDLGVGSQRKVRRKVSERLFLAPRAQGWRKVGTRILPSDIEVLQVRLCLLG